MRSSRQAARSVGPAASRPARPAPRARAQDCGEPIRLAAPVAPEAPARQAQSLTLRRAAASPFVAVLRDRGAGMDAVAPYAVEAFHAGHRHPPRAVPARPPFEAVVRGRPVARPLTRSPFDAAAAARLRAAGVWAGAASAPAAPPAAGVTTPRPSAARPTPAASTPEQALRDFWAVQDQASGTGNVAPPSAAEREALDAIARQAGVPAPRHVAPSPSPAPPPAPAAPAAPVGAAMPPEEHPHSVFDRMGAALAYANTFDVGDVAIRQRFRELDAALDAEARGAQPSQPRRAAAASAPMPAQAAEPELDDFALMQDLLALRDRLAVASDASPVTNPDTTAGAPLSPTSGGRVIGADALVAGDVVVATSGASSRALLHVGDGMVAGAAADGVALRPLADAIADATHAVVLRHPRLTAEQAGRMRALAGGQPDAFHARQAIVRALAVRKHADVCRGAPAPELERCRQWVGRVELGTPTSDAFHAPQLLFAAYADAGAPLTATPPCWSTPQDVVEVHLAEALEYVGHLKPSL